MPDQDTVRRNGDPRPIEEIDVLLITAGLGCDGESIAMTAATQPSIEDIVRGGLPWISKVNFHNPVLAFETGEDFLRPFHEAAAGRRQPFILVIEGSIPDEKNKEEGYWATAPPTAESTLWKETPPGVWGWRTTWASSGNPRLASQSCAFPDVRSSRTISWRRCFTCSTSRQAGPR